MTNTPVSTMLMRVKGQPPVLSEASEEPAHDRGFPFREPRQS
jgi:hypothetical protein